MQRKLVAQAAGMVSVQADCTPNRALMLMTERSQKCGCDVEEIAKAVIDRRVRFPSPTD